MVFQPVRRLRQAQEHEIILAKPGLKKSRYQIEHYGQGSLAVQGQLLGVELGPVIPGPLVPAEP